MKDKLASSRLWKIISLCLCFSLLLLAVACQDEPKESQSEDTAEVQDDVRSDAEISAGDSGPTGIAPREDSDFGLLSLEEQEAFLDWIGKLQASYENLGEAIAEFNGNLDRIKQDLRENGKLADSEAFKNFRAVCEEELEKLSTYAEENIPRTASRIQEQVKKLNGLYREFLSKLEQADGNLEDFSSKLEAQNKELFAGMQEVLDAIFDFTS